MGLFNKNRNVGIPMPNQGMMFPGINAPQVKASDEQIKALMSQYQNISTTPPTKDTVIFNGQMPQLMDTANANEKRDLFSNRTRPVPSQTSQVPAQDGGFLGGVGNFLGGIFSNPAAIAMATGTGLGLLSGQLSPIQSLGAGAQGANPILAQQQASLEAEKQRQVQLQMAALQKPLVQQGPSAEDLFKLYGLDKSNLSPEQRQRAFGQILKGQTVQTERTGIFGGMTPGWLGGHNIVR